MVIVFQVFFSGAVLQSKTSKKKIMELFSNKWVNLVVGIVAIGGAIVLALVAKDAIDKHKAKKVISTTTARSAA